MTTQHASMISALDRFTGPQAKASAHAGNMDRMKSQAQDFEAMFLTQMLEPMFDGIGTDGYFGGGNAENIYRSMMLQEYGKIMAKRGGVGMADAMMSKLLEMQEAPAAKVTEGAPQ